MSHLAQQLFVYFGPSLSARGHDLFRDCAGELNRDKSVGHCLASLGLCALPSGRQH